MIDFNPIVETITNFFGACMAALIGRITYHIGLVQRGVRRLLGIHLLLELPVAIFMGFVGSGLAEWLSLPPKSSIGLVAALSYLGPNAIEYIIAQWLAGKKSSSDRNS